MAPKIVIDARKLGDEGIGIYIENLVSGLLSLRSQGLIDCAITLLVAPRFHRFLKNCGAQEPYRTWKEEFSFVEESAPKYSVSEYVSLPRKQREVLSQADLFHSPHFTLPFFLEIPSVVTIHDLIHVTHPERWAHRALARRLISSALKRASLVMTVSQASATRIEEHFRFTRGRVFVVHNALQHDIGELSHDICRNTIEECHLPSKFCLFVGSDRPHKGFAELVDAWALLAQTHGAELPHLLVVGARFGERLRAKVRDLNLEGKVWFLGRVSRKTLASLYTHAQAVVVPSRVEGFGLPALEALASETPVICSPDASLRELCQDTAWYAEALSGPGLAAVVGEVLANPEACRERAARGLQRARGFTRESSALRTCEVYEHILGEGSIIRAHGYTRTAAYAS